MKNSRNNAFAGLLLLALMLSLCTGVYSQQTRSWKVDVHGGTSFISGDVKARTGFGGGVSLAKNFNSSFALRLDYTASLNRGQDLQLRTSAGMNNNNPADPWYGYYTQRNKQFVPNYQSAIHQGLLSAIFKLYNWNFSGINSAASIYGVAGYSALLADVDVNALNSLQLYDFEAIDFSGSKKQVKETLNGLMDNKYETNGYYKGKTSADTKNLHLFHGGHAGIGGEFNFSNNFGVALEYRLTVALTDALDAIEENGKNDLIHFINLRAQYSFGSLANKPARRGASSHQLSTTSAEALMSEAGFINAIVMGEATKETGDSSYFFNVVFTPTIPGTVTPLQSLILKLENKQVLSLPFASSTTPLFNGTEFSYRARVTHQQLITLASHKVVDMKIETAGYNIEDRLLGKQQKIIPAIARQLLRK